ncbi:MAG: hypothetical protein HY868_16865 [Chloroflexi bacterium]|nr:hypothetical protein [Chloroflexota bacterium]
MTETTLVERAELFCHDVAREHYLVGAGLKDKRELAPIYERHADLFDEATVHEQIIALQRDESNATRHLADFAVRGLIDHALTELNETIANAESQATIEWKGKPIPYRHIRAALVRESDWSKRHDLHARQLAVMIQQNPQRIERIQTQHDLARRFGFAGYRAMIERVGGWDLRAVAKQLKPLLDNTTDMFERDLETRLADARVPRKEADTSDVAFFLRAPQFDELFPASELVRVFKGTVAGMGLDLASTPGLTLDADARPHKSPRAFCSAVRVPDEVYLVVKPIGGHGDYRAFFHAAGRAEHFTHFDANLPFEFRRAGDEAVGETFAFLFEHLTQNPRWLVDILRVPTREAEKYRRLALFDNLWAVRRYVAKLQYELILHDDGLAGADDAYTQLLSEALRIKIHAERYLDDIDDAFHVADSLRAWIRERQLANFLLDKFGEGWYETREAGSFLQSLWSIGLRDSIDELARTRLGAEGLNPKLLIEELGDF